MSSAILTKDSLQVAVDAIPYWYHRIELPGGIITPGWAPLSVDSYKIPDDLAGRRVLDLGSWDGFWSFLAAKNGADSVLAIDDHSDTLGSLTNVARTSQWTTFDLCNEALGYKNVHRKTLSIYDVESLRESFDVIFCFGLLYHLKHPLLALERLRSVCIGEIYIETAILDGVKSPYSNHGYDGSECSMEFYAHDEYGCNHSNWWVGTLKCWASLVEAAGFKNIESWKLKDNPATIRETRGFIKATV